MAPAPSVRLTELMAALSLVSDLGMGQPMEHNLRQCLIASRLGDRLGLDDDARRGVFHAGIMAWVGCHVDAYEQAKWFGDEMALKGDFRRTDFASERTGMAFMLGHIAYGQPVLHRARVGIGFIGTGMRDAEAMLDNHVRAVGHRPRRRRQSVGGLTARELEVLRLLARGLSNKQIARELRISRKTVGNHIEHVYVKLDVSNRAMASLYAAQHGLID